MMAFIVKQESGGNFEPCPAGNHVAICTGLVRTGLHESMYDGASTGDKERLLMFWTIKDDDIKKSDGSLFVLSKQYKLSLHEKSALFKDLNSWRGRAFTADELKGFDLNNVLRAPCLLNVTEFEKDGRKSTSVQSISPLPKGMPKPIASDEELMLFDTEDPSWDTFNALPIWTQGRIKEAKDWSTIELLMNAASGHMEGVPF